jgi:hypothetical protein
MLTMRKCNAGLNMRDHQAHCVWCMFQDTTEAYWI